MVVDAAADTVMNLRIAQSRLTKSNIDGDSVLLRQTASSGLCVKEEKEQLASIDPNPVSVYRYQARALIKAHFDTTKPELPISILSHQHSDLPSSREL